VTSAVRLAARGVHGLPEVAPGDDLAVLVCAATALDDGDVVVVSSKAVSKAEGRVVQTDRESAITAETARVVARRGDTTIARTRHGLTLAAAGVDASNVSTGSVVLLPEDPDASARRLRDALAAHCGRNVAVVISDTAGRTWREGQTDIAVGVAGLDPLQELAGAVDTYGNALHVTAPAVADEVAAAADLVMGKLTGVPVAVVSGLAPRVLPPDVHGPGAAALVRPDAGDMFGLGSREAVLAAVARTDAGALGALRRERTEIGELVALATSSRAPARLDVEHRADGSIEISGDDDLPTAAALERVVVAATTTQWHVVADDRNSGRCRLVVREERAVP